MVTQVLQWEKNYAAMEICCSSVRKRTGIMNYLTLTNHQIKIKMQKELSLHYNKMVLLP